MTFLQVYNNVLRKMSRDPATWDGDEAAQEEIADMIAWALHQVWQHTMWSQLLQLSEETVTVADNKSSVAWDNERHIYTVWPQHPYKTRTGDLPFVLGPSEIIFSYGTRLGTTVFVEYRPIAPEFTRVAYNASTTYSIGDVVYDSATGQCFRSLVNSNTGNSLTSTAHWELQQIPDFMVQYVVRQTLSELFSNDGQSDRSYAEQARANNELERILVVEEAQQRQHRRLRVTGK